MCLSQCELGNLFGGKDILNVRIKTQTMEFAGDNNKTDWGGWIERRLSVSIYGAEVKGPQPASPPYQYYTKKLELAEKKQVWKKDSMTNGEAIFPKRPVKTTGFFSSVRQKKTCYNTFWQKFSLNFAASVYDIVSGLGNKSIKPEESSKIRSALNNKSYISITINWIIRILTNCKECFSSFSSLPKKYPKIWLNC